jgi:hypothetical protein
MIPTLAAQLKTSKCTTFISNRQTEPAWPPNPKQQGPSRVLAINKTKQFWSENKTGNLARKEKNYTPGKLAGKCQEERNGTMDETYGRGTRKGKVRRGKRWWKERIPEDGITGVRQGSVLTVALFDFLMNETYIKKHREIERKWSKISYMTSCHGVKMWRTSNKTNQLRMSKWEI